MKNRTHKILIFICLGLFFTAVFFFSYGWRNEDPRYIGVAFVVGSIGIAFGLVASVLYEGEATLTIRAGGQPQTRINPKTGDPFPTTTNPRQGKIIKQTTYYKGEKGYVWAILLFCLPILLFILVGLGLIFWTG